jgi:hypothetical protein
MPLRSHRGHAYEAKERGTHDAGRFCRRNTSAHWKATLNEAPNGVGKKKSEKCEKKENGRCDASDRGG